MLTRPPKFQGDAVKKKYVAGLGKVEKEVIILLDIEKLVVQE